MSKIRVLTDQLANQIAAGEVVERPASVAKELIENAIDAGARRLSVDVEAGGRRLLRVADDGEGMTRDDAVLAFERHATSKISCADDLYRIATLGFRGEALASIASVARVELTTNQNEQSAATRVLIEGGRMRDVKDAAHPRGTTISVRDLFFNVPARRKFLRSEATESFHLTNLVTHYALAHPEIAFTLTNNGREILRASTAADLRERAYQIFGASFLENLLEVGGGHERVARVRGYVSAPRERRTSRDAQYLFINGRFVRDRLISRSLAEGYRSVLPQGTYPVALLFLDVPLEEVDVNVHPAKTEVRFRRAAAVADTVRDTVRDTLASAGYARAVNANDEGEGERTRLVAAEDESNIAAHDSSESERYSISPFENRAAVRAVPDNFSFGFAPTDDYLARDEIPSTSAQINAASTARDTLPSHEDYAPQNLKDAASEETNDRAQSFALIDAAPDFQSEHGKFGEMVEARINNLPDAMNAAAQSVTIDARDALPPLVSAASLVREVSLQSINSNIRPLGQLDESFIIATDDEGLLLIDQHIAHERILFDKYLSREAERAIESQHLLVPETFDLTPAQAIAFDALGDDLENYGFSLMRLSGRTVAIKAVPSDLPANEARNLLAEILDTMSTEKRGNVRATSRERIAASLACRAAVKAGTPLAPEKMRWLIDRLLVTSSPTTCPHGRPVILRIATRDITRGFHKT